MCGIAGYIGRKRFKNLKIQNILSTMKRRGPDSNGFKEIKFEKKVSTIGMNNINLSYKVDDSLLSGFKLITDSKVYDLSLKSVLNQFQEQLRVTTLNTDETNKLKSENVEVS